LVFDEANPLLADYYRPDGYRFVAICKVVQCNHLELVQGAKVRTWINGPAERDAAACVASPAQFTLWQNSETAAYNAFYIAALIITSLCCIGLYFYHRDIDNKETDFRQTYHHILGAFFLSLKLWDLMTDYAFTLISVAAPRFKFMLDESGEFPKMSFASFQTAAIFFTVLSTLSMIPDFYGFYERAKAIENKEKPPKHSMYIGLTIVCVEDVPQLLLSFMYIGIIGTDANLEGYVFEGDKVDGITIISIFMTVVGMLFHVCLAMKPEWFYDLKDPVTGREYEHRDISAFEKRIIEKANDLFGTDSTTPETRSRGRNNQSASKRDANDEFESVSSQVVVNATYDAPRAATICSREGCKHSVARGSKQCKNHTCKQKGCKTTKSSKTSFCLVHTPEARNDVMVNATYDTTEFNGVHS